MPQSKTITLSVVPPTGYEPGYGAVPPTCTISNSGAVSGGLQPATVGPFTISSTTGIGNPWATATNNGKLELEGNEADLVINGKSLATTLAALEERLNILVPNPSLEKEWDELKQLGDRYRELEKELKEKAEVWNRLKAQQD